MTVFVSVSLVPDTFGLVILQTTTMSLGMYNTLTLTVTVNWTVTVTVTLTSTLLRHWHLIALYFHSLIVTPISFYLTFEKE